MIGARFGCWILDRELGRGGMGCVYLAHREPADANEADQAAIKVLAAELTVEPGFLARFQREIDILRQLDHPNIVRFHASGQQNGRPYFIMEYVPGPSFESLLTQQGRVPWPDVLDWAWQIAPALKHAHDRGVIHRDVKLSNLLLSEVKDPASGGRQPPDS
ncbi:MAG: serine/threonine protein kinase, partial [Gemmataceae bacterium]